MLVDWLAEIRLLWAVVRFPRVANVPCPEPCFKPLCPGQGSSSDDNVETGWMQLDFDMKLVSGEIVALARILGLGSAILIMALTDLAHPQ